MQQAPLTLVASAVACAVLQAAPLTPARTLDRRAIGELEFSPDGTRLAFTVTEPPNGAERPHAIWILDVATGRARQATFSGKSDSSPHWSPDGSSIAFLSDRDGVPQLYLLPMNGGDAERPIDRKEPVGAFRWSPDGRRIALLMPEARPQPSSQADRGRDDARRVDRDERRPRIWILDVARRSVVQATSGPWRIGQIDWMRDGEHLIVTATATPADDRWTDRIYSVDLADPTDAVFSEVAAPHGPIGALSLSPDGRSLAYVGARVDGPEPHDLFVQRIGGSARNVTASTIDRPVGLPRWIDASTLAATVARGFASAIALIGVDGRVRFVDAPVNATAFARADDGTLAFAGESAARAPEVWLQRAGSAARVVTTLNDAWSSVPVVAPELVKYKSFDGREIEAALLRPAANSQLSSLDSRPSAPSPAPFVVLVHGGPTGRWTDVFEPWGQLLAQRGYAVLYPNVRGSIGYGSAFVEMNRADWGGGDYKDVMAGVDWAIARGIADPNRLGIGGWSYGGYMAAWAVTQTHRFKAAVSGAPVIDLASEFGTETGPAYDEWFYGTPYEKLDGFVKSSPMTYVKNARTPTLLLQGEDDRTDPIGQSQQFYRGLKRYGVDAELVLYPREPHGLREERHLVDRLNRILAWYDKYLKPAAAPTSRP